MKDILARTEFQPELISSPVSAYGAVTFSPVKRAGVSHVIAIKF